MKQRSIALWAGLILIPFGEVDQRLSKENPWRGFDDSDPPHLVVTRAERFSDIPCERWIQALESVSKSEGKRLDATQLTWRNLFKESWEPWKEEEREDLEDCDDLPCKIKLGPQETQVMAATPKKERPEKYLELVEARVQNYSKTQERKEYEFPGQPSDPWARLEGKGFRTALKRPSEPMLYVGRIRLSPGKAKDLHQVLDRRFARGVMASLPPASNPSPSPSVAPSATQVGSGSRSVSSIPVPAQEAILWVRDAYTDHYFDSWGEWHQITCNGTSAELVQALFVELDLLKKTDLLSRIGRGKMKSAIQSQGGDHLQRVAELIRARATAPKP